MLSQTFSSTLRQWRLPALVFLLTLLPALPTTLAFFSSLKSEAAGSLAPLQLLPAFNYTVFADFMHDHGGSVWSLIRAGWLTALLSLLISVWAKGGILYSFTTGFRAVTFWQSGTHYFSRNLRLLGVTILFVLLWLLLLVVVGFAIGLLLDEGLNDPFSERGYVAIAVVIALIFGVVLTRILCTSQYASVMMYQHDEANAFRAFRQSWRFIGAHRRATFGRYLLLILIGTTMVAVYLFLESLFTAHNWLLIVVVFLFQQAFVVSRVVLNIWALRIAFDTTKLLTIPASQPRNEPPLVAENTTL